MFKSLLKIIISGLLFFSGPLALAQENLQTPPQEIEFSAGADTQTHVEKAIAEIEVTQKKLTQLYTDFKELRKSKRGLVSKDDMLFIAQTNGILAITTFAGTKITKTKFGKKHIAILGVVAIGMIAAQMIFNQGSGHYTQEQLDDFDVQIKFGILRERKLLADLYKVHNIRRDESQATQQYFELNPRSETAQ